LILLDYYFTTRGGKDYNTPSLTTNEIITASSPESPTTGIEKRSFTNRITKELERLTHRYKTQNIRFTAVNLHNNLFRYNRELLYTPFCIRLTNHECMSIDLTSLPPIQDKHTPVKMMRSTPQPSNNIIPLPELRSRVLVNINTTRTPNRDLITFLRSKRIIPDYISSVKIVKIETVYKSYSTLTLISLPLKIWELLPPDKAYKVIKIVTSDNILPNGSMAKPYPSLTSVILYKDTSQCATNTKLTPRSPQNLTDHPNGLHLKIITSTIFLFFLPKIGFLLLLFTIDWLIT